MTSNNNFDAAEESYTRFLSLLKIGAIGSALVAILVVVLIS
jgi:hypothetical protein